jgi:phosphodiesterase/alkaline phosphatase D-like protein
MATAVRLMLGVLIVAQICLGAGHPILVVGTSSNQFSFYCAEVLRAEGMNAFDTADISSVTSATLAGYDVVVLGQMPLTSAQVTTLTNWVNAGGNLIAMRPDKQLASLLGIADAGSTLSNGYLLVNTAFPPGAGIVAQTIQFHGAADLYTLAGATSAATLYSTASAPTAYPAVTVRTGIGSGGSATAFTYDLARSVVYTRQGNPAWAGEARIGQGGPVRAADMFYGNAVFDPQPDWVDLNKISIPQADEQQRLLANLILYVNQNKKPLPRFWYLPFGKRAAVIMTGDDHGGGATAGRFDDFIASSPAGCSVANWECIRATSYLYPYDPLTDAQAASYIAQGFELALHLTTGCVDYTPASIESNLSEQLGALADLYPSIPPPTTNRTHCVAWSDWGTQPQVELNHGIRLDTTYYYWPPSWVVQSPGFFTGSGMPMRFAQTDGTVTDVYQATTQMTDESGQTFPDTINGLLDDAVGPAGFYGVFTANMHNDQNGGDSQTWADEIVASAKSHGVPVVSAKQMLQWLDGRNGSSFDNVAWNGSVLSFSVTAATGANGLQGMVPASSVVGALSGITQGGVPVSYSIQTIKGIQYALFSATAGAYQVAYATGAAPVITAVTATPGTTTATITWTTDKSSDSRVDCGTTSALGTTVSNASLVTSHSITLTGLTSATTYYYRVTSTDSSGHSASSPAAPGTATFQTVDPTPPVISAVVAAPGLGGTATISWATNKLADSRVDYGATTALGSTVSSGGLVTAHSVVLTGLTTGATYYYRVTSTDVLGNSSTYPVPPATASFLENPGVSVWGSSTTPSTVDSGDPGAVELGLKFRSDVAGIINAIRFYKAATNTGTHIGNLWSSTGTLLGTVTFTNETASGWQRADLATPVSIAANTTYVVSYYAPNGHYSVNVGAFSATGVDSPPLHALASGVDGLNGVYRYGSASGFPTASWNGSNYWVDVVFLDNVPPVISAVTATPAVTSANIIWTTNESSNSRVDYGTTTSLGTTVSSATTVTAHSVALTGLTTGVTYYYRVTSVDPFGNSTTSPATGNPPANFTPTDTTPPVISAVTATPGTTTATITWTTDKNSGSQVDYGTTTALGTTVSDATLATAHSMSLTGLSTGTTYYFRVTSADVAGHSASSPVAPATATFTTIDPTPPVITAVTAAPGANGTATITWATNKPSDSRLDYGSTTALGTTISSATMVTAHSIAVTGLTTGATYYYRVTSTDALGNSASSPVAPATASFVENAGVSIWASSTTPAIVDTGDTSPVELGLKFRSDVAGTVAGVRFYKAAANTGTHIGNLWSSTGTLLATVTFSNETSSGWQQANFSTPVPIAANTTYIVSYYAPNGRYSADLSYFSLAGANSPPLHALASGADGLNGVYRYGSSSGFPSSSWNDSNYWVDLVFYDNVPPTISGVTATPALTSATITWTTDEPSSSRVDYGTTTALGTTVSNATLTTSHSMTLTGLATGTTYYFRVMSADAFSNSTTSPASGSVPASFTPTDTSPPVISSVSATPGTTTATITWTTDKNSDSRVDYGPTTALGSAVSNPSLVAAHSIALTGLTGATTYYFRVTSTDSGGHSASSPAAPATASFTTIDPSPPLITAVTVTPGPNGTATVTWTTNKLSDTRVDYGTTTALGTPISTSTLVTAHTITLTGLTVGTTYYYRVTSTDALGNAASSPAAPATASFIAYAPVSVWNSTAAPGIVDSGDPGAVEVGMKFRSDVAGPVAGVRFYKSAANTGTHIGNLWSSTGTLLATVTFTNETASGWQQALFSTPVMIAANTTYIVSYFAPSGHYSATVSGFTGAGADAPPLHALASGVDGANGIYRYGSASGFPTSSWNDSNYWVDVVFYSSSPAVIVTGPEPAGWFAGDMHVHRSCGDPPESVSNFYDKMAANNLSVISLLADMGNGEVQNPVTDLPLVNGQDDPGSTPGRILHWDAEWHWDPIYLQYPHQALGGHIVTLGLTSAQQIWSEYTYPIFNWAHQQGAIAGFAHLEYLDDSIPQSLTCCTPIEYPVEVALGASDFVSEDVTDVTSATALCPDCAIHAYYRLLNTGFRPGYAGGTDYPCNNGDTPGSVLTYVRIPSGQLTYNNWIQGIAAGRTIVSRNGHKEFLDLKVNSTYEPGDEIQLAAAGTVQVSVTWTATENLTGTIELVSNGVVVASQPASASPGVPATLTAQVTFSNSGWLAARRMGPAGHYVQTGAVFVTVNNAPVRASSADAQFFVQWMDNLLSKTSPGGQWNSLFVNDLAAAQARYEAAKAVYQQIASEAAGLGN